MSRVERDTEILIDNQLKNLGWNNDPNSRERNVYLQRPKTEQQKQRLQGKRPDYILYQSNSNNPIAIIEAKKPGGNIHDAITQGAWYARQLEAPLVFATDGVFTKAVHIQINKPLILNGEEVDGLIRETLAIRYLQTHEVNNLDKRVIKSRGELISIFSRVNNLLREEGLQKGLERFIEFSNILFLKVLSEIEDGKEERGIKSTINNAYRWNYFRDKKGQELLSYISDTVLKWFAKEYQDENIFQSLQIKHPENLKEIIDLLDELQLTDINADIKGDAFEYFIRSYSTSNASDLGEIFTPRHIVKTMVKLLNPKIGETIYDPFCGTGSMLIVAFKHIMDGMAQIDSNIHRLKQSTLFGTELTKTASIAKMNMILAGDGHSNIKRQDSFANPLDNQYDIVITNFPFSQKTRYGDKYTIPSRKGDIISPQHCFCAIKEGGRMAMIAPDGFLSNINDKSYSDIRKYLLENATLKSIISLPRGSFEPYNRAKASILYFTDIKKIKTQGSYFFFDVKNDGYTLDTKRKKIDGNNDLELILSECNLEEQNNTYLMSLGITKINMKDVYDNSFILNVAHYQKSLNIFKHKSCILDDILEISGKNRVEENYNIPIMSITMERGLVDQQDKFKKRIASTNISKYKKVSKNELVVGFPIDEGVLGFQTKYDYAAVSPAYKIWKLKRNDINIEFLDILLRSNNMKEIYKSKMQGSVDRRRSIPDDIFLQISIPLPPFEVQKAIVESQKKIIELNQLTKVLEKDIQNNIKTMWNDDKEEQA